MTRFSIDGLHPPRKVGEPGQFRTAAPCPIEDDRILGDRRGLDARRLWWIEARLRVVVRRRSGVKGVDTRDNAPARDGPLPHWELELPPP